PGSDGRPSAAWGARAGMGRLECANACATLGSMKLARKLMIALVLGVLVVMGANAILRDRFERRVLDEETDGVQYAMGLTVMAAVEAVFRSDGADKALRMLSDANDIESRVNIRWVWLDDVGNSDRAEALLPEESSRIGDL